MDTYKRETLRAINERIAKTLELGFPFSFKATLGTALAGLSHMLHGHIDFLSRNILPDTAEGDYLKRWADIWLVQRQSKLATIDILIEGPIGLAVRRFWNIEDKAFKVTHPQKMEKSPQRVKIEALEAGEIAINVPHAIIVTTAAGFNSEAAIVVDSLENGAFLESEESWRARLLRAIQSPPQGGSALDYIHWAEEVPGVKRAWVRPAYMHAPWSRAGCLDAAECGVQRGIGGGGKGSFDSTSASDGWDRCSPSA